MSSEMKGEEYSLVWERHTEHVSAMLSSMMVTREHADVTLVCRDKLQLEAHKLILSSCSSFFGDILSNSGEGKPIIYLPTIGSHEMQSILQYVYRGETSFLQERTQDFIRAATDLEIKGMCENNPGRRKVETYESPATVPKEEENENSNSSAFQAKPGEKKVDFDATVPIEEVREDKESSTISANLEKSNSEGHEEKEPLNINDFHVTFNKTFLKSKRLLQCISCEDFYNTKRDLNMHLINNHYICISCGFQAGDSSNLREHKISIHKFKTCSQCDFITSQNETLRRHKELVHNIKPSNKMQLTNWSKKLEGKFERRVLENGTKLLSCNECEYENPKYMNMSNHIQAAHLKIRYQCDQCDHQSLKPYFLQRHIECVHLNSLKFHCNHCDERFNYEGTLKSHIDKKHLGKTLPCTLCKSTFSNSGNMNRHMKKYHS